METTESRRPEEPGFSADWLSLREPADNGARNRTVLGAVTDWLAARSRPGTLTIVDMGCGTGSTVRAVAPLIAERLPSLRQRWVLCDADRALLEKAETELAAFGKRSGLAGSESLSLEYVACDLADAGVIESLCVERGPGLVTGSALIDLVSGPWLDAVSQATISRGCGLYFALNYSGEESWLPAHPADAAILDAFNRDQRRDKGFGPALGGEAIGHLAEAVRPMAADVTIGDSDWRLEAPNDRPLMSMLAEGIAEAAVRAGIERDEAENWLAARRIAERAVIGHEDIAALPT